MCREELKSRNHDYSDDQKENDSTDSKYSGIIVID